MLEFSIDNHQYEGQLYSFRKSIESSGFKYRDIEDWMYRVYKLWKTENE